MMLGGVGRTRHLGSTYADALPAGTLGALPPGMGPTPWANYPGSGGPNQQVRSPFMSPDWRYNTITTPIVSPSEYQNRQRVFNGGYGPGVPDPQAPWAGASIRGYTIAGLGSLVMPWQGSKTAFTMGTRGLGAIEIPPEQVKAAAVAHIGLYHALGAVVGVTHGYKRNKHWGWAAMWGGFGFLAPFWTTGVAIVQGFGKPKGG